MIPSQDMYSVNDFVGGGKGGGEGFTNPNPIFSPLIDMF